MTCRTCGVEIADKAIVCYRCGTPTAVAVAPGRARRGWNWLGPATGAGILASALWLRSAPWSRTRAAVAFGALALYLAVALFLWRRRS